MTAYTWKIHELQAIPEADGLQKIVSRIVGTLTATADDGLVASQLVNVKAGPYDAADFTAFEDLTEATVIGWMEACMTETGLNDLKAVLEQRIEETRNLQLIPPWETTAPL